MHNVNRLWTCVWMCYIENNTNEIQIGMCEW